ncbi:hypothetical protein H0H87_009917, partial [Tephrocybe sp. NHM501043]
IWAMELAQLSPPSVSFTALDISSDHFPPSPPSNVDFVVKSVADIPADDWANKFAFVHQRLLVLGIQEKNWPSVLRTIYNVTKPGGWIQLGEFGKVSSGPATARLEDISFALCSQNGVMRGCAEAIPTMLKTIGFLDIRISKDKIPIGKWGGKLGDLGHDNFRRAYGTGLKPASMRNGNFGIVKDEEEFNKLLEAALDEWNNIEGSGVEFVTILAMKPL